MIRLVTFDLDNTLWEVTPVIIKAEKDMRSWLTERVPDYETHATPEKMAELRNSALTNNPALRYNISDLRVLLLTQVLGNCSLAKDRVDELAQAAFAVFMQGRNNVEFYPEALPMIRELAKHYRLAGLTNGNADISDMPLAKIFEFNLSPDQVQARKPQPAIFGAMLDRTGVSPDEVVHVGDHLEEDVAGAVAAGWRAVWVNLRGEPEPATAQHHASVTNLGELPDAIKALDIKPAD